jgi:hypothetical protein
MHGNSSSAVQDLPVLRGRLPHNSIVMFHLVLQNDATRDTFVFIAVQGTDLTMNDQPRDITPSKFMLMRRMMRLARFGEVTRSEEKEEIPTDIANGVSHSERDCPPRLERYQSY